VTIITCFLFLFFFFFFVFSLFFFFFFFFSTLVDCWFVQLGRFFFPISEWYRQTRMGFSHQ